MELLQSERIAWGTSLTFSQHKADGSHSKALKQLSKYDILILDDWGLENLKATQRNDLMEIMDDRHQLKSTIMVSQLPTEGWYQAIGDNTLADTILDRLMHNPHRLKLKGESMRKVTSDLTENKHLG
ncbi:ATP-binding protein [Alishewanella sp. HL-SH06]|uniref:ATP-binding protein n=1 Tax=Alishewanella sp. HL-SH06 TaxID=3461144 RepID=UPI0040411BB0